jgi:hypothetical protein
MRSRSHRPLPLAALLGALVGLALTAAQARAQAQAEPTLAVSTSSQASNPPPPEPSAGGPTVSGSAVGYIDCAIPASLFRLRFDSAYDLTRPSRAEFFYARGSPFGPGLEEPEKRIDYQELSSYLEVALCDRFSAFLEAPVRFLNPEVNENNTGFSDLNAGGKYAFLYSNDLVGTFQLRTYVPTGDPHRGLGTNHVSLEPAFLGYARLTERLALESEFRVWIPIGGDPDFAGEVLRYGLGFHYDLFETCKFRFMPVVEFVGWTVLSGEEQVVFPNGDFLIKDAAGDTIVNVKVGARWQLKGVGDLYTGYGRSLTGDTWYRDIFRVELRLYF